jgi:transcriptional regulator with XRE-family HTH domain
MENAVMKSTGRRTGAKRAGGGKIVALREGRPGPGAWSRARREPETIQFGRRLQALRAQRAWSLADVARLSGISMATLSRIENNKLSPTLDIVCRLLNGLGVPYHELLIPSQSSSAPGFCIVTKRGRAQRIGLAGATFEVLSRINDPSAFYAVILTIDARRPAETHGLAGHEGEEFLHVLSGALELHRQDHEPCVLDEGDSAFFDSSVPHDYVPGSAAETRVLIVTNSSASAGTMGTRGRTAQPSGVRQLSGRKI